MDEYTAQLLNEKESLVYQVKALKEIVATYEKKYDAMKYMVHVLMFRGYREYKSWPEFLKVNCAEIADKIADDPYLVEMGEEEY